EVVKYMENAFLATKVAFCNEFFELCETVGVDYERVRQLWLEDDRINPSHTVVTEERGYGGQCLPKDTAAISASARALGVPMEILEAVQEANARHRANGEAEEPLLVAAAQGAG
ncbi:MAG TPA: UDP-glucose 6-dehydrogenase, partial [Dehalococcoidia bacterium]|nr:UDP-glucose 6-dehydrogenase [Dehalococcoidia bacterium]